MRILFAPLGGFGHVLPALAIAEAARDAGHEAAFIYHPRLAPTAPDGPFVEREGFRYFPAPSLDAPADLPGFTGPFRADAPPAFGFFRADKVEETIASEEAAIRAFQPDVVLADWRPTVTVATRAAKLPLAMIDRADLPPARLRMAIGVAGQAGLHRPGLNLLRPLPTARWMWSMVGELGRVTAVLNDSLRRRRLRPVGSVFHLLAGDLAIVPNPPSLDPRKGEGDARHIGHVFRDLATEPPLPDDMASFRAGRRLVYVTFGTYYQDAALADSLSRAFPDDAVVMTAPHLTDRPVNSDGFRFYDWLPARRIASEADVVIHHGGHGTLLTTLAAGTPSVTFAAGINGRDVYARRQAALGASIHVSKASGPAIRDAVTRISQYPQYRARSMAIAGEIAAAGGPAAAVRYLETLARQRAAA